MSSSINKFNNMYEARVSMPVEGAGQDRVVEQQGLLRREPPFFVADIVASYREAIKSFREEANRSPFHGMVACDLMRAKALPRIDANPS